MDAEKVGSLIKKEVSHLQEQFNDLKPFFCPPEKVCYETLNGNHITLWKIFQKDEYQITFSDERTIYGVAFKNVFKEFIYLGGSGTLIDAVYAYLEKDMKDTEE
jgi:hypothetical protein